MFFRLQTSYLEFVAHMQCFSFRQLKGHRVEMCTCTKCSFNSLSRSDIYFVNGKKDPQYLNSSLLLFFFNI